MTYHCIDVSEAAAMMADKDAQPVDIRDPDSFRAGHIPGAAHLDNQSLESFLASADRQRPLIVCCYHGNSSRGAAQFLAGQGFEQCYSLDGGFSAWQQAGLDQET